MSEARIDRLLAAALHQAIADLLPDAARLLRELPAAARLARGRGQSRPRHCRPELPAPRGRRALRRRDDPGRGLRGRLVAGATAMARPGRRPPGCRPGCGCARSARWRSVISSRPTAAPRSGCASVDAGSNSRSAGRSSAAAANRRTKRTAATTSPSSRRWSRTTALAHHAEHRRVPRARRGALPGSARHPGASRMTRLAAHRLRPAGGRASRRACPAPASAQTPRP